VLIVEDNQDIREISCEALAMAGFEVTAADTGVEALEKAPAFRPNAVLLDVGLPDLTGYDVARRLQENPPFASTLLIALTGYASVLGFAPKCCTTSTAAGKCAGRSWASCRKARTPPIEAPITTISRFARELSMTSDSMGAFLLRGLI
jgi:hypothetical protein